MNLGLTTSFIIGALLLLSILSMNLNLSQNSTELTMHEIAQERANTISEILQKDVLNIGSKINDHYSSPIKNAEENHITFKSDIDHNGSKEIIEWEYTNTEVNNSPNPDDHVLVRRVNGSSTTFKTGVTNFKFTYLDKNRSKIDKSLISVPLGGTQSERDRIRYINIAFTVQSKEEVGGAGTSTPRYVTVHWKKQFTPVNLKL